MKIARQGAVARRSRVFQAKMKPMATRDSGAARRATMYGSGNLAASKLFSGHFINFGYWTADVVPGNLTEDQRTASQADLYREVLRRAGIGETDAVLEVGCGIGVGAVLALREFGPQRFAGLDLSGDQVARAERVNAEVLIADPGRLSFRQGSAFAIPFQDSTFDRCISIEAAQHFDDLPGFAAEAYRILKPGGRLTVATFFTTAEDCAHQLAPLIETIRTGVDVVAPIGVFAETLRATGFELADVESIGEHVWHGYDAWMQQSGFENHWARNWLRAYRNGRLDYYVVSAAKPAR
ncbi:class I SAM-dependent methyltransferase [Nocardia sp. alder85J]|uniref:class I SAM-dependent methyltransferase n=1 Tax=Nocardia sp. alder85J TaxID=2862949 RepID=UPI001CD19928|nr:class I SAM-dependent methyltransferase [Nocardia sp. alder85J]MCX4091409.1 methyltransferase domain-containing protein [Nocardia sp. alder85J]